LAALDAQLRADMLAELQKLRRDVPDVAIVYVTHDQSEALALADRIAVMRDARLVDIAPAADLYAAPSTAFTASFLGGANLLPVELVDDGILLAGRQLTGFRPDKRDEELLLCIRPHAIKLVESDGWSAQLVAAQWRGAASRLTCALDGLPGVPVQVDVPADGRLPEVGSKVAIDLPIEACTLVAAEAH
jgi:2-aminoethylphosphonate transport system ATP-binding protein